MDPQHLARIASQWARQHQEQTRVAIAAMQVVSNGGAVFTSPVRAVETPGILLQAVVILGDKTAEGQLVRAVAVPWFEIVRELQRAWSGLSLIVSGIGSSRRFERDRGR